MAYLQRSCRSSYRTSVSPRRVLLLEKWTLFRSADMIVSKPRRKICCKVARDQRRSGTIETTKTSRKIILVEQHQKENLLFKEDGQWIVEPNPNTQTNERSNIQIKNLIQSTPNNICCLSPNLGYSISDLFLPTRFKEAVSSDYLSYQLWTLPCHITGWVSASLATSSLLRAVGVGAGAVQVTSVAAAIKWITKDGVGALGKLLVGGGRLGVYFDEEPRLWRMTAEGVSTIGLALEIATVFFPHQFLLLAGFGNFAKALAKGMANPAFLVIQQHFSKKYNIGEIAAKEESWEVAGQSVGLLMSVGILTLLEEGTSDWQPILIIWLIFHSVHILCRYFALDSLQFDFLNVSRANRLISAYMRTQEVPDPISISTKENFLLDWALEAPNLQFGCSLKQAADAFNEDQFQSWVEIYQEEQYLLHIHQEQGRIFLKEFSDPLDCLKAFWQYSWLMHQNRRNEDMVNPAQHRESLVEMNLHFHDFEMKAKAKGWNLDNPLFRVGTVRLNTYT